MGSYSKDVLMEDTQKISYRDRGDTMVERRENKDEKIPFLYFRKWTGNQGWQWADKPALIMCKLLERFYKGNKTNKQSNRKDKGSWWHLKFGILKGYPWTKKQGVEVI